MASYYEPDADQPFEPMALVVGCMEHGTEAVLVDQGALPAAFFDLSTGLAGEVVQKLANYRLHMAVVLPDPSIHSPRFQEFAREANRSAQCRFFATREAAIDWLASLA
jgi:hypothetical protein